MFVRTRGILSFFLFIVASNKLPHEFHTIRSKVFTQSTLGHAYSFNWSTWKNEKLARSFNYLFISILVYPFNRFCISGFHWVLSQAFSRIRYKITSQWSVWGNISIGIALTILNGCPLQRFDSGRQKLSCRENIEQLVKYFNENVNENINRFTWSKYR